ncbi:hypothetical protein SLA_4039 [Streptomyces laurentii]|uniref:Uncharacterized protein n=1 Tax=Streptomyces laurentii TaxID=39478 RepID=A0A169NPS1_STRLU|nr:hypothetical protein SLA_4039 [Streptomyces laurentii]
MAGALERPERTPRPAAGRGGPRRRPAAKPPPLAYTSPIDLLAGPAQAEPLLDELVRLGTVVRLTNPSQWDAVVTAILRRSVPAGQAARKHGAFFAAYGRGFRTEAGEFALVPSPRTVLVLSDEQFDAVGAAVDRLALRAVAEAYLDRGGQWTIRGPACLAKKLAEVPYLGSWAAAVAAADVTGDFSVFPHGDPAVRAGAGRVLRDGLVAEDGFEEQWHRWAPTRAQLHALTLFTLTWAGEEQAAATPPAAP